MERQYFSDDDSFQELLEAEDDLIDSYVRGELPDDERAMFEKRVAALPRLRQRVDAARGLEALADGPHIVSRHAGRAIAPSAYFAAAAALLLVVLGVLAGAGWWRQRVLLDAMIQRQAQLEQELRVTRERLERDRSALQALRAANPPTKAAMESPTPKAAGTIEVPPALFVLTALTRGSGSNDFERSLTAQRIILRAPLDDASQSSYRVTVQRVSGGKVWSSPDVRPADGGKARYLHIEVPASALPPDDYFLMIANPASSQVVQEFSFRIRE